MSKRIALVALIASIPLLAAAACSLKPDSTDDPSGANQSTTKHHNAADPAGDVPDVPPSFKHTSFLNDPKTLFKGLKKADFAEKGYHTTGSDSASVKEFDSPVKNQGSRGWCTAFAQVGAIENLVKHQYGDTLDLSEIDHWMHYQEYDIGASANAAKSQFIVPEEFYPYNGSKMPGYSTAAIAKMNSYRDLGSRSEVMTALKAGHPVVIGLDVDSSWESIGSDGRVDDYDGGSVGGHAVLVVGMKDDPSFGGGGYMTIKNSWSSKWGDRGYLYLPYAYCQNDSCYFVEMISADYKGHTPKPPDAPDAGPTPPPPTPDAGPTPPPPTPDAGPTPPPGGDPTAWDIDVVAEHDPAHPDRFKVKLYGHHPGDLAQVAEVTYDIDESFGDYEYWSVNSPANDFAVPFYYRTWSHHWQTKGAVVYLKSGNVLYLAGAPIDW